jgi:hypothetical protein
MLLGRDACVLRAPTLGPSLLRTEASPLHLQVAAMQRDSSTYCDEPPDSSDYANWRSTHSIAAVG